MREKLSACLIDADNGLAFAACSMAVNEAIERASDRCRLGGGHKHHSGWRHTIYPKSSTAR